MMDSQAADGCLDGGGGGGGKQQLADGCLDGGGGGGGKQQLADEPFKGISNFHNNVLCYFWLYCLDLLCFALS